MASVRGRPKGPQKLNKSFIDCVALLASKGYTPSTIAATMGIARTTFNDWVEKGRRVVEGDTTLAPIYGRFYRLYKAGESVISEKVIDKTMDILENGITETDYIVEYDKDQNVKGSKVITRHRGPDVRLALQLMQAIRPDEYMPKKVVMKHEGGPAMPAFNPQVNISCVAVRGPDGQTYFRTEDGELMPQVVEGAVAVKMLEAPEYINEEPD